MPPAGMNDAGRKFSWATQRIHELEKELDACRNRIKVLLESCNLMMTAVTCPMLQCQVIPLSLTESLDFPTGAPCNR